MCLGSGIPKGMYPHNQTVKVENADFDVIKHKAFFLEEGVFEAFGIFRAPRMRPFWEWPCCEEAARTPKVITNSNMLAALAGSTLLDGALFEGRLGPIARGCWAWPDAPRRR